MTLVGTPDWAIWLFAALLAAAAIEDLIRLRISNLTNAAILVLGLVAMALVGPRVDMWQNIALAIGLLALGTFLFARGWIGGGDVKLLAASGLWFGLSQALLLVTSVALAGGALAILIIVMRLTVGGRPDHPAVILRRGGGIPYGIAIAAGVMIAFSLTRAAMEPPTLDLSPSAAAKTL